MKGLFTTQGRGRSLSSGAVAIYQSLNDEGDDGGGAGASSSSSSRLPSSASFKRQQSSDEFSTLVMDDVDASSMLISSLDKRASILRSGRQRKKLAVRTKGGEFQARRRKRRVYFCSISDEIDVERIYDDLTLAGQDRAWSSTMYTNVLHLYLSNAVAGPVDEDGLTNGSSSTRTAPLLKPLAAAAKTTSTQQPTSSYQTDYDATDVEASSIELSSSTPNTSADEEALTKRRREALAAASKTAVAANARDRDQDREHHEQQDHENDVLPLTTALSESWAAGNKKELFVFDFGAIVFWGFSLGEEENLLAYIRSFTLADSKLSADEFSAGEDDMAFVTSSENKITIANDVFTLPDETTVRQRLAISFAIAQSSVLAIFEARIETKVEEFKYIPESFARDGAVKLSSKKLGKMIGDVFVIRHDVNLHTEILDTPDWFWSQQDVEGIYKETSNYLEMAGRTEILNKRLDMLKQLLSMLQQQNEAEHNVKLEIIIIWLIVISVVLELISVGGKVAGWWD